MELIKDKLALLINPDLKLAKKLINEVIEDRGLFVLDDSIKEELTYHTLENDAHSFFYKGIYPNHFTSLAEIQDFKEAIDELLLKTNTTPNHIKINRIDDLLFITLFYSGYSGGVYSTTKHGIYLDELADVFVKLQNREPTSTNGDSIYIQDQFTGVEESVPKSMLTEEQLMLNDGYKVYSRMIGNDNRVINIPNDGKIIIQSVHQKDNSIELSERLSKHLTEALVDYIIKEHRKANSTFYNDLSKEDKRLTEWSDRLRPKFYERHNKILKMLILKLDSYIEDSNKGSVTAQRHIFIYNLLALLKLMPLPRAIRSEQLPPTYKKQIQFHRLQPIEKSSAIRTILKDN